MDLARRREEDAVDDVDRGVRRPDVAADDLGWSPSHPRQPLPPPATVSIPALEGRARAGQHRRRQPTRDDVEGQDLGEQAFGSAMARPGSPCPSPRTRLSGRRETVMSLAPSRASPRPAVVTAVTSVVRAGLLEAAVATGSPVIPLKRPAPVAGTEAQAGRRRVGHHVGTTAGGGDGRCGRGRGNSRGSRAGGGRRDRAGARAGAGRGECRDQDETGEGPGAIALVHRALLVVDRAVFAAAPDGWDERPARDARTTWWWDGQVTVMTTECQPVAPSGTARPGRRSGCRRCRPSRGPRSCGCPLASQPDPLAPGVDLSLAESGPPARPAVDADLDPLDARCCAHATPATATLPARLAPRLVCRSARRS